MKKKSGRRILSLLMAVILVIGTLQVPGLTLKVRADTVESGTCGNGVTYVLDSDGVLTISKTDQGTGEITDKPWVTAHRDDVKKLVIEDGVINLPDSFFGHFFELTSVSIAGSVKKIEAYCFQGCYKLGELILSEGLESIDEYAFDGCKELESVTIPKSVSKLEGNAFEGCDKLKAINVTGGNQNYHSVDGVVYNSGYTCLIKYPSAKEGGSYVIPDTVTEIGAYAFYGCSALTDLTIPASVTAIGAFAFAECSALKDITIPASVTDIGRCAFVHCDTLTSITMSVIGDFCFMECSALTSVVINDGVKEISYGAFRYCPSLAAISIPKSITKIQDNAFEGCNANAVITYPGSPGEWSKIDISDDTYWGQITLNCTGGEIVESDECGNGVSYDLDSNGILYISGTGAVTNHPWKDNDIRKVLIGKGVTDVTAAGFINCSYLEDISVKNGNKVYSSEDGVLFNKNKTELIQYHCNKDVDEYTVPDAVTTIKGMAFAGCSALKSIAFSDSVISIEEDAFKNCSSLTDVYYGGAGTKWDTLKNNNIGANNSSLTNAKIHYMKGSCGSNAAWTLTKDGVLTISGTGEIEEVNGDSWKVVDVKEVVIGNGVTAIGDGVFGACCMTSVTIPENVTSVGEFGFAGCDTLEEVTFLG
nr:leucine-rich repeat domain-containing protein [Lachnospiraceae bacterium]